MTYVTSRRACRKSSWWGLGIRSTCSEWSTAERTRDADCPRLPPSYLDPLHLGIIQRFERDFGRIRLAGDVNGPDTFAYVGRTDRLASLQHRQAHSSPESVAICASAYVPQGLAISLYDLSMKEHRLRVFHEDLCQSTLQET